MVQSEKKTIKKKIVISICCLVLCAITLTVLSLTRYRSEKMEGQTRYEPALFNTALLGQLVEDDVEELSHMTEKTYSLVAEGEGVTQTVTGQKLSQSLTLSSETSLGGGATAEISRLAPGNGEEATVYFTVTNGTTTEDDTDTNIWKLANTAESDIRYTLHIITTNNLPLNYQLFDLGVEETGEDGKTVYKEYQLEDLKKKADASDQVSDEANAGDSDYIVKNADTDSVFHNGARILKCVGDGSITVHRYMLKVTWPGSGNRTIAGTTVNNNDLSYMKELENIQILLEVESYVQYISTGGEKDMTASGVLVPSASYAEDSLYKVSDTTMTLCSDKIVRYNNLVDASSSGLPNAKAHTYSYTLYVCNGDSVSAVWTDDAPDRTTAEDPVTGTGTGRKSNGHYTYSGTYHDGDYHLAIAVPNGTINDSGLDRANGTNYYLKYKDVLYTGTLLTDQVVSTVNTTQSKRAESGAADEDTETTINVYQLFEFKDVDGNLLKVELGDSAFQAEEMTLYMTSDITNKEGKDDFRLYLYK